MIFLPILVFVLLFCEKYTRKHNLVESCCDAWLLLTCLIWGMAELLSTAHCWNTGTVAACYGIMGIVLVLLLWKRRGFTVLSAALREKSVSDLWKKHKAFWMVTVIAWLLLTVTALLRSQGLVDNLTHRFAKIVHWMQNQGVGPFATESSRQVQLSDLAEYLNAQILLLGGSDRLMNLVQLGAHFCAGVLLYGICRKLEISRRLSAAAVWFYWLIPMGLIEVCTTQTDVVAAVYLFAFIYYLLDFISAEHLKPDREGIFGCVRLAACVMFGYLSKPTVCFAMVIFMLWMALVRLIRRDRFYVLICYAAAGLITAAVFFLPSYLREKRAYAVEPVTVQTQQTDEMAETEEPTGTQQTAATTEETGTDTEAAEETVTDEQTEAEQQQVTVPQEANKSMVLHNLTNLSSFVLAGVQNLATNATSRCFPEVNVWMKAVVDRIDRRISYGLCRFHVWVDQAGMPETSEPSPCIMWFTLAACILIFLRISRLSRKQLCFFWCSVLSLLIQSGLMGYTYFRVRYLLGVMGLLCVCFAVVLQNLRVTERMQRDVLVVMFALSSLGAVNAMTYEMTDAVRGCMGSRIHQYFVNINNVEPYYDKMLSLANEAGYTKVAVQGEISYEYVIWQMVEGLERLEAVNVQYAPMQKYEDLSYIPECIFLECKWEISQGTCIECHGETYCCTWEEWNDDGICYAFFEKED